MQLCAGLPSGGEAGAAALQRMWEDPEVEAIIMIDARNAFNTLNRAEAINTAWEYCPIMGRALQNLYATPSALCAQGIEPIMSQEGSTQGCPAGMAMYGIGSIPVIKKSATEGVLQIWYADDSAAAGKIEGLKRWYEALDKEGPAHGYFVKLPKTAAIVKCHVKPGLEDKFREVFGELADQEEGGMKVVVGKGAGFGLGRRYLGVGVGTDAFRRAFVEEKVTKWCTDLDALTKYARTKPHHAYCLLTKSVIPSWRYVMRTMPVDPAIYQPLEDRLVGSFLPAALGWAPSTSATRRRLALPLRHGGLAIPDPCELAASERGKSSLAVDSVVNAIMRQDWSFTVDKEALKSDKADRAVMTDARLSLEAEELEAELDGNESRTLREIRMTGGASWLAAIPLEDSSFALSQQTFRDVVALLMGQPLPDELPPDCPSCGSKGVDVAHLLMCPNGGWIRRRHTEVLKELARLLKVVCGQTAVYEEPELGPIMGGPFLNKRTTTDPGARTDIAARGFFEAQMWAHFDVTIIDTACKSALKKGLKPETVLANAQRLKRDMYEERVKRLGGSFTPFAASVYGTLAPESEHVIQTIMSKMPKKEGGRGPSEACARLRIQLAIVKATSMCIRSRSLNTKPSGAAVDDAQDGADSGRVEEECEEPLDLEAEWGDLRTGLGHE
jgi:hypothetical protein